MRVVRSGVGEKATRAAVPFAAAALLLLGMTAVASASRTEARGSDGRFCAASKNVAHYLVDISKQLTSVPGPTKLKAEYGAIKAAEPALKSSAPGRLKPNVVKVLTFADTIAAHLAKANWNIAGLLPYVSSLQAQEARVGPSLSALKTYYRTTCKFDV